MSWLNNSLNTIKGQLTNLANEVLAETAGPGDDDYQGFAEQMDTTRPAAEQLHAGNEKDMEIDALRRQIAELQNKMSGVGVGISTIPSSTTATAVADVNSTKSPTTNTADNNVVLEDSWCWEPDNNKNDNDHSSESSSGNGNEMVNITLEETPLRTSTAPKGKRRGQGALTAPNADQQRLQQLENENKQLNLALEQLDNEHNLAMQNVLELKAGLQMKLTKVTQDYEALKQEHANKFINSELEYGKLKKQIALLENDIKTTKNENQSMARKIEDYNAELTSFADEMADLQKLLDKKNQDNIELIEKLKATDKLAEKFADEHDELLLKLEQQIKEIEELKSVKEKKTSESSTSSSLGKQSEDEFIVVREADASSASPTTPPTKEELKDKIVQLEARVSELILENGNIGMKLQDRETEKDLTNNILKENCQALQLKIQKLEEYLQTSKEQLEAEQAKVSSLTKKLTVDAETNDKIKELTEDKTKIEAELNKMQLDLKNMSELEKRLLFSEQEKESLQLELQSLRTTAQRVAELEDELKQVKQNKDAANEQLESKLVEKIYKLTEENSTMRAELERAASDKFRQAIAEEKQEITDLDADEEECCDYTNEKLLQFLEASIKRGSSETGTNDNSTAALKALRDKVWQMVALEKKMAQINDDIVDWQDQKMVWEHEKTTLEADISQYILQCNELMKNNEILLNEVENCKRTKLETIHENNEENMLQLETQLDDCNNLNRTLQEEYAELTERIEELEREKQALTETLRKQQLEFESKLSNEKTIELQIESLELEKSNLLFELNEQKSVREADTSNMEKERELEALNLELTNQLLSQEAVTERLRTEVESMAKQIELDELKESREQRENAESEQALLFEVEQLRETTANLEDIEHENRMLKEVMEKANAEFAKTMELNALRSKAQAEEQQLIVNDLQKSVDALTYEKEEIMKVLQSKHSENMQYYMEIQRLQPFEQQCRDQQLQNCEKCPILEATIAELHKEHEKLQDQINFLKEKSDILTTNLLTEQTNQKLVHQEKNEVLEQNAAIRKDLERLREHLLEIEDMHTQETMEMQRELTETKAKMVSMQEEVCHSSNAYTSASIRANQHAETLQAQFALVVQQRDDLVAKLSLAEDRELKNQAALCNLQCALEQFQNGKENDIHIATQRIRKELQLELDKETELKQDVDVLKQQLADANQGLRAASRLTDQLESQQQIVATLREEVESLKEQNNGYEAKLQASESSQTDKIEKSLIKSLLIGYVVSGNPNDKNQVLRMISSILDFTPNETEKVGLNKQQSSWLGAILGGGTTTTTASTGGVPGVHTRDNLVQAFVQFLEQESQPQANRNSHMPNLLNITQNAVGSAASQSVPSRRTSVASNNGSSGASPASMPIQPLQLNSNVLDDFAPTRNSSSILKDILSDS